MNATVDADQMITPGDQSYVDSASPTTRFAVFFEDDGDTGYFYAVERIGSGITILDAVQVYVVAVERAQPHQLRIVWSRDGLKSALLIDILPQAVFDFAGLAAVSHAGVLHRCTMLCAPRSLVGRARLHCRLYHRRIHHPQSVHRRA